MEAFTSARLGTGFTDAHDVTNNFFPGIIDTGNSTSTPNRSNTAIVGATMDFRVDDGVGKKIRLTIQFVTPISAAEVRAGTRKFRPFNITKVEKVKK